MHKPKNLSCTSHTLKTEPIAFALHSLLILSVASFITIAINTLSTANSVMAQQYSVSPLPSAEIASSAEMDSVPIQINQIRLNANLPALAIDPLLQQAAQMHALDMITYANWSHIGTDGSRVKDRVLRAGYVVDGWTSENWVSATNSVNALKWWMNSPVHRDNILAAQWREFGIGSVLDPASGRTIYVAVFATGRQMSMVNVAQSSPAVSSPAANSIALQSTPSLEGFTAGYASKTIRPGDTLFGLAEQFNISWAALATLNGWSKETVLQVGGQFVIPAAMTDYPAAAALPNVVAPEGVGLQEQRTEMYLVQPGDTLISIAQNAQIEWQLIAHLNDLRNADMLQIGQRLVLPSALKNKPRTSHIIEVGDTIISVAAKYNMDWETLLRINELTESSVLQIGQEIWLSDARQDI